MDITQRRVFLQAWSPVVYRCSACQRHFQPLIHTQSGLVRFGAVGAGLGIYLAFSLGGLGFALPVVALVLLGFGMARRGQAWTPVEGETPAYGQLIAACVYCRSREVAPAEGFAAPTGRRFVLRDPNEPVVPPA